MKTTKELLSQIKDTILNRGEEQADELLREFVISHIKNDRETLASKFGQIDIVGDLLVKEICETPIILN